MVITGNVIDLHKKRIFHGQVIVEGTLIKAVEELPGRSQRYILPGFVDAHVHIESSMLVPSEFARLAVRHGTVATVSDPHEIANVLGTAGVEYMIDNGRRVPFRFNFGAPSCVPATAFETAGAVIDAEAIERLLRHPEIRYLSEMMNYPGVLSADVEVMAKIEAAKRLGKPIDGHAPGLRGEDARRYFAAGISTDHECVSLEEGREKARLGVKILIREGSAARNFETLFPLLEEFPAQVMFCSDDKHPDDLLEGHINRLVARALAHGCDLFDTLRAACLRPVVHYGLPVGLLRPGDPADLIVTTDIESFEITQTWIGGQLVAEKGQCLVEAVEAEEPNRFEAAPLLPEAFRVPGREGSLRVIRALDGELITESFTTTPTIVDGFAVADPARDLLKIAVVNRYAPTAPAVAFISGFHLQRGAIASSVAHDSHNIVAVGTSDEALCCAVNKVIEDRGGISLAFDGSKAIGLPLPVAGLMAASDAARVARQYGLMDAMAKAELCSTLRAPFMTLSFMALLVIPQLKLSDKGLFDGASFRFVDLFE